MPKIIESVREQLLQTAKKQLETNGYAKTTVRSVAAECGIAVGTVYNYFASKDMLIASFMAEDWESCVSNLLAGDMTDAKTCLYGIYGILSDFVRRYAKLFADPDAEKTYAATFPQRHEMLREKLAEVVMPFCPPGKERVFTAKFVSEALITWTVAGVPFETLYPLLQKAMLS